MEGGLGCAVVGCDRPSPPTRTDAKVLKMNAPDEDYMNKKKLIRSGRLL